MKVWKNTLLVLSLVSTTLALSCQTNRTVKVSPPDQSADQEVSSDPAPVEEIQAPEPVEKSPAQEPVDNTQVFRTAELLFLDGKSKLEAGQMTLARSSFDAAVDLILSSGVDLRLDPRLKSIFDELFNQLYQLEAVTPVEANEDRPSRDSSSDTKFEPAAVDELGDINVYPIRVEQGLRHLVEEDILNTKYDIPIVVNEPVIRWLEYYKSRGRKIMELGLRRIGLYRDMIHRIFSEAGLPKNLIYLAQQESMFKPRALSRARAKGMWQFIYSTGKRYGLVQNWWIDEKLDPEKSTRAAAAHLCRLYQMFGDWYLVMAAYNSGENGIRRITEKTRIHDFWELADRKLLHRQTINYVPSILATIIIGKHPEKYGFDVEPLSPVRSKRVQIPSPVDLTVVAETLGMSLESLRRLNPELRRMVTPANQKYYDINLPVDESEEAVKTLAAIPEEKRVRWHRHVIKKGESLWVISRHYGVSIGMIKDANNMSSSRIRAGRYLLIPSVTSPRKPAKIAANRSVRKSRSPSKVGGKSKERKVIHKVRRGDTLYEIARKYRTTAAKLKEWNGLKGNLLHPGDTLLIFLPR